MRRFVGLVLMIVGGALIISGLVDPQLLVRQIPDTVAWLAEKSGFDLIRVKLALTIAGVVAWLVGNRAVRRR